MKAIAIIGSMGQPQTLLADLLHWHGLSVFQLDDGDALLPLLSFVSPELIIIESLDWVEAELVCDRIKQSSVLGPVPVIVCTDRCSVGGSADAYLCSPYTAEDVFANVQALRPIYRPMSDSVVARLDS